jgi:hypothetical protein
VIENDKREISTLVTRAGTCLNPSLVQALSLDPDYE